MMQLDIKEKEGYRVSLINVSKWLEIEYSDLRTFIDKHIKYLQDFGLLYKDHNMYYLTRVHVELVIISLFNSREARTLLVVLADQFMAANKEMP